jgi:hypothetical protein
MQAAKKRFHSNSEVWNHAKPRKLISASQLASAAKSAILRLFPPAMQTKLLAKRAHVYADAQLSVKKWVQRKFQWAKTLTIKSQ